MRFAYLIINEVNPSTSSSATTFSSSAGVSGVEATTTAAATSAYTTTGNNDYYNYNDIDDDDYNTLPQQPLQRRRTSMTRSGIHTDHNNNEDFFRDEAGPADVSNYENSFGEHYEREAFYNEGLNNNNSIQPQQQLPTRKLRSRRG